VTELRRYTSQVATQPFRVPDPYGTDSLHLVNLVAHFHVERATRVLLGAHYDTRPRADQERGAGRDLPVPGANDGASGTAVLLEIARALGNWDPGIGVDLVFFDGEDYGKEGDLDHYLLGSRHYAKTLGTARPRAMILLDMVGDRDLSIPMEGYSVREASWLAQLVFGVADSLHAGTFTSRQGPPIFDDHVPFLQAGIPALDLIDFDYPAWHTLEDLPDKCSPASLESVARVLLHSLQSLRGALRPGGS
jgi:Zn-dependent M28 family amino/carboxypeptidase